MVRIRIAVICAGVISVLIPRGASAQAIPRDEYLTYVPLEVPTAFRQTSASALLHLYGDRNAPDYLDADADGIDDRREEVLQSLAVRFAPLLVMNSTAVPMDLRRVTAEEGAFPLTVDTWSLDTPSGRLTHTEKFDVFSAVEDPCTESELDAGSGKADCRLRWLLEEYDLDAPASAAERTTAREPGGRSFQVLWVDYPGRSESEWNDIYVDKVSGKLPRRFQDRVMTYVHPFIHQSGSFPDSAGFELVLQYWFFYPWNDGGNNHLGDWEHINVVVAPLESVTRPQSEYEILEMLSGDGGRPSNGVGQLVVRRIEYYFHSKVWTLDFSTPNAYAPRAIWEEEVSRAVQERGDEDWFWNVIRNRAWADEAETRVNTHPIAWIGADNKGLDQLLSAPGGTNRDSHGTYLMPGLYKDIGPAGATENVPEHFDHKKYWSASIQDRARWTDRWERGGVVDLAKADRIEVIPDVERIAPLAATRPEVRASWAWLLLPIRFGYPAVESPFAGVVSHAETGNLAVFGPSFSAGWNRSGQSEGFATYDPNKVPRLLPLAWQDNFINSWGWLNLTAPTIAMFPPIDFLWRIVAAPFRAVTQDQDPTFYPVERLPLRYVGLEVGYSHMNYPTDPYVDLLYNKQQFGELLATILAYPLITGSDSTTITGLAEVLDPGESPFFLVSLYMGDHFVTENSLRHSRSSIGVTATYSDVPPMDIRGDLNFWEYSGTFRYDLKSGAFRLFPKAGYGLSWYRIEGLSANGEPFQQPDSDWIRKPGLFENLLPNTWHAGAGLEWIVIRNYSTPPKGIDFSLRMDFTWYTNKLGLELEDTPLELLIDIGLGAEDLPKNRWVGRSEFRIGGTVSF